MKTKIVAFLTMATIASGSLAQEVSTEKIFADDSFSSKGFRVGILKGTDLFVEMTARSRDNYDSQREGVGELQRAITTDFALSLGYASLPVKKLGWTANFVAMPVEPIYRWYQLYGESRGQLAKVDGNLAYAFSSFVNIKGGLNVSKMDDSTAGLGAQAGVGFQFTKTFGLDLDYIRMRQWGTKVIGGRLYSLLLTEDGWTAGLHATF